MQVRHSRFAHHILAKPQESRLSRYAAWAALCGGLAAFLPSVVWLVFNVVALRAVNPDFRKIGLPEWSNFGQAAAAPLALANLGVVVISAYYVIKGLHQAESAVKMGYQPLVACSVFVEFDLIGEARSHPVRFINPRLNLLLQNLGDSPATFVEIELMKITFHKSKDQLITLAPTLKQRRALLDHLGTGKETSLYRIPILEPNELKEPASRDDYNMLLIALVSSILMPLHQDKVVRGETEVLTFWKRVRSWMGQIKPRQTTGARTERLECEIQLAHRNVLALPYKGRGTFAWDRTVMRDSPCDPSQIEFIANFEESIGALKAVMDRGNSTKDISDKIGHYLKSSHRLLGVVLHKE